MKLTKLAVALSLVTLSLLTSCGPNTINTPVEVTNLTLSPATTTMLEGETLQLVATTTQSLSRVSSKRSLRGQQLSPLRQEIKSLLARSLLPKLLR